MTRFETATPGETEVESLWAEPVAAGYRIDNIPFYVQNLALGDVVAARQGEEGELLLEHLVSASGHTTVRLAFQNRADVQPVRAQLVLTGPS